MSPATRLQPKPRNLRNDKYTYWSPEPTSASDSGHGADSDSGPGGDNHLGNKTGFPPRTWSYPHAMPSAAARKTQGARAHPLIPLDRPGGTPRVHSGRFPPLTGGCFLIPSLPHPQEREYTTKTTSRQLGAPVNRGPARDRPASTWSSESSWSTPADGLISQQAHAAASEAAADR